MKRQIIFLILIMFSAFNAISQRCVISADRHLNRIIYLGIDNYLKAVIENHPCRSVLLTTNNGAIIKTNDCKFKIFPDRIGPTVIRSYLINKRDTVFVDSAFFRVKNLPEPTVTVAMQKSGTIKKSVLNA